MSKEQLTDQLYWLINESITYPDLAEKLAPAILKLKLQIEEAAE
jgi:hypothetical protein